MPYHTMSPDYAFRLSYTLSHPRKGLDVTERAQGYPLQDASLCVNPVVPFWTREKTHTQVNMACAITSIFLLDTRWRDSCSQDETKYRWFSLQSVYHFGKIKSILNVENEVCLWRKEIPFWAVWYLHLHLHWILVRPLKKKMAQKPVHIGMIIACQRIGLALNKIF